MSEKYCQGDSKSDRDKKYLEPLPYFEPICEITPVRGISVCKTEVLQICQTFNILADILEKYFDEKRFSPLIWQEFSKFV